MQLKKIITISIMNNNRKKWLSNPFLLVISKLTIDLSLFILLLKAFIFYLFIVV